jgi:hypothetical protein
MVPLHQTRFRSHRSTPLPLILSSHPYLAYSTEPAIVIMSPGRGRLKQSASAYRARAEEFAADGGTWGAFRKRFNLARRPLAERASLAPIFGKTYRVYRKQGKAVPPTHEVSPLGLQESRGVDTEDTRRMNSEPASPPPLTSEPAPKRGTNSGVAVSARPNGRSC